MGISLQFVAGSSPLARGLPVLGPVERRFGRIIPARAGFTSGGSRSRCRRSDHPRSRGVYMKRGVDMRLAAGSSPLARGLRFIVLSSHCRIGIIPARAGFTTSSGMSRSLPTDHPRSRGVYPVQPREEDSRPGSSPLARGLRRGRSRHAPVCRIIPARAGFTYRPA